MQLTLYINYNSLLIEVLVHCCPYWLTQPALLKITLLQTAVLYHSIANVTQQPIHTCNKKTMVQ